MTSCGTIEGRTNFDHRRKLCLTNFAIDGLFSIITLVHYLSHDMELYLLSKASVKISPRVVYLYLLQDALTTVVYLKKPYLYVLILCMGPSLTLPHIPPTSSHTYSTYSMPSTQKALFLDEKFGSDLVIRETEIYKPGPGELLVKVKSTSLNPIDWKVQKDGLIVTEFPAILGTDIAGDVEEVGEGVTEFKKGDRVYVLSSLIHHPFLFVYFRTLSTEL